MGLLDLFRRVLRSGKEEDLRSEPVEDREGDASGQSRDSELTSGDHESEEKFHEEELQSMETLADDTWIYEEGNAETHYSEIARLAFFEQKPDIGEVLSDVDETVEVPATVDETLALGSHAEQSPPVHDHVTEKDFPEGEQRCFEIIQDKGCVNEEINTPTECSIPDPGEVPQSPYKVPGHVFCEPPSQSDGSGLGRSRQRLSLKKSHARSSFQRPSRIGHKIFLSNKDADTGHCLPPRTTQEPYGIEADTTLPVEEMNAQRKKNNSTLTGDPDLRITVSTQVSFRTDFDSQSSHQDVSISVKCNENTKEVSCPYEAAADWGEARLPVPSEEDPEPSMAGDLEGSEGGLVVPTNQCNASPEHVLAEQSSVATRLSSEAGRFRLANLKQEDVQESTDYLYEDHDDYSLTAFFEDDVYDHDSLGDFAQGAESLEDFEGFTEEVGNEFEYGLTDQELLDEALLDEGPAQDGTRRISQYLRACQRAAEFIRKNHWDDGYLHALAEVLNTRGYGAILTHLQRHADDGMVPEEFQLAIQLKAFWSQNRMLWIAFYRNGGSDSTYRVLSWAQCLRIIGMLGTSMGGIPQIEEVERFIEDLFDEWYQDDGLRKYFKSFSKYLNYVTYRANPDIPVHMQLKWEPDGLEHEDVPGWVPIDPMRENLRRQLMYFGMAYIVDNPETNMV